MLTNKRKALKLLQVSDKMLTFANEIRNGSAVKWKAWLLR